MDVKGFNNDYIIPVIPVNIIKSNDSFRTNDKIKYDKYYIIDGEHKGKVLASRCSTIIDKDEIEDSLIAGGRTMLYDIRNANVEFIICDGELLRTSFAYEDVVRTLSEDIQKLFIMR